jgi:hypothetical protein
MFGTSRKRRSSGRAVAYSYMLGFARRVSRAKDTLPEEVIVATPLANLLAPVRI